REYKRPNRRYRQKSDRVLIVKDIKRLNLSIEHLNDFTVKKNIKKNLVESFNYYLEKDQISAKNLDIDDLKIQAYLNKDTDPQFINLNINSIQQKNLANLF
ncbi:21539_t:CDS:1, partial [Racocetra persica]